MPSRRRARSTSCCPADTTSGRWTTSRIGSKRPRAWREIMTGRLRFEKGQIAARYGRNDGSTTVVRTQHMAAEEVEFLRWKAERWMKVRHIPAAFRHDPWFVLSHGPQMMAHTFRGSTLRSMLGWEDERVAFQRYKAIRQQEREYV